ncbi:MAG: TerC/Alx family metal homeostasis membrane protein [Magnetococcales bacterium]|nr:TerC/Alx family metal homeostasis membrane protein [Magnetococcales bacterium]MBF0322332.1 TerC/Alx family metal homeostasis membrane protein [Magnetococcales bacterium]
MFMEHFGFPLETISIFVGVIVVSLYMDLHAHPQDKEITFRDAVLWSGFWVCVALGFYVYLYLKFDKSWANLYLAGYVLEKSLSVDNLMVFIAIFSSFAIHGAMQHRILYYGIIGALAFRAIFVLAGTSLFAMSSWVEYVFAAIVAWSGWKMLTAEQAEKEIKDYSHHWSVTMTEKVLPVFPRLHGGRFFLSKKEVEQAKQSDATISVTRPAALYATPALLCLMAIETSDVMFAFDSVPAVIAVTREPLLVYAAMIFAILGLRSLYFVLAALTKYLVHLSKAVIALLFFIAGKLALTATNHIFHWPGFDISPNASLLVVVGVLGLGVLASFIWPEKDDSKTG